jgi:flagellar hook-length control protein FliK
VQPVAFLAAVANATNGAPTAEGRTRQTSVAAGDGVNGNFMALLAHLLQGDFSPAVAQQSGDGAPATMQSTAGQAAADAPSDMMAFARAETNPQPTASTPDAPATIDPRLLQLGTPATGLKAHGPSAAAQTPIVATSASDSMAPAISTLLQSLYAPTVPDSNSQPSSPAATDPGAASTAISSTNPGVAGLLQSLNAKQGVAAGVQLPVDSSSTSNAAPTSNVASSGMPLPAVAQAAATAAAATGLEHSLFAQAAQHTVHQATPSSVTEARALPLHFDLSDTISNNQPGSGSNTQSGQQDANTPDQSQSQTQAPANNPASNKANAAEGAQFAQDQNPVAQNIDAPASSTVLPSPNATNGMAAAPGIAQSSAVTPAATLQVGPANQAADQGFQPNIPALAVSIAAQSQSGAKEFDIRMDPPELGRVEVRLTVDSTGKAQAHLAADKPQTLELLQSNSGALVRALKDSGVQLSNNGLQFSLKGQDRQGDGSQQFPSRGRPLAVTATASTVSAGESASLSSYMTSSTGVDIRV